MRKLSRQRQWQKRNPDKHRANVAVQLALLKGVLVRPLQCEECQSPCLPHAHHDDYSKRLEVRWLCPPCHRNYHALQRAVSRKCRLCDEQRSGRGLCRRHYYLLRHYGDAHYVKKEKLCECGKKAHVRGRCKKCAYKNDPAYRASVLKSIKKHYKRHPQSEHAARRRAAAAKAAELPNITHCDEYGIEHRFSFSIRTLRTWRYEGRGPPYYKDGRRVVYSIAAVEAWIIQQEDKTKA